jgi:hypothetical protein
LEAFDPLGFIEWVYDPIEERFGQTVAWLTTLALGLAMVALRIWVITIVVR